ncbi:MAG: hypothetical protein ABI586_03590, partial [Candidatus Nanopelagicales bacterium]
RVCMACRRSGVRIPVAPPREFLVDQFSGVIEPTGASGLATGQPKVPEHPVGKAPSRNSDHQHENAKHRADIDDEQDETTSE